jgi:L-ascorbate metabolism protein UlaG (beta-lactamase superfamily)
LSGDTIYLPELAKMKERFRKPPDFFPIYPKKAGTYFQHKDISVALLNIGKATAPLPTGPMVITMDGAHAAQLFKEIEADVLVPMHFESWGHFAEQREALAAALEKEGVMDKVLWLEPGVKTALA